MAQHHRRPHAVLLAVFVLLSCDVPSTGPEWESRWVVPTEITTIEVAEFLPSDVRVAPGGDNFEVDVDSFTFTETLGDHCGTPCQLANGQVVPKPAFNRAFDSSTDLPSGVVSMVVSSGTVLVQATNQFSFDPIRPGLGNTGSITLTLFDGVVGGRVIDQAVIDGATSSFSPGETVSRTMDVSGAISSTVGVQLLTNSPAGSDVLIDVTDRIDVTATPQQILVSSAVVEVADEEVSLDPVALDVEDIDEDIVGRIRSGALVLEVTNPLAVGVSAQLVVAGQPGSPITKPLTIGAESSSTVTVDFTAEEFKRFLGVAGVTLSGSGTVLPGSPAVTLRPDQVVTIETSLDLTLLLGGEGVS